MRFSLILLLIASVLLIPSFHVWCDSSSSSSTSVDFVVGSRGLNETWIIRAFGTAQIIECRQRLAKGDNQTGFPNGVIGYSNESSSYKNYDNTTNRIYRWYMKEGWAFADATIELCDGRATYVDDHLDEWIEKVKNYCPWGGYIKAELPPNHSDDKNSAASINPFPSLIAVFFLSAAFFIHYHY